MPATATDRLFGLTTSVALKAPVRIATTTNVTLSGLQTIAGVALAAGDRVLVWQQSDQTQNGIYLASTSAWTRSPDFDGARDVVQGTMVIAQINNGQSLIYQLTTANPITIGSSSLVFRAFTDPNRIYPLSVAETDSAASPTNYSYTPEPVMDARRYGWDEGATAAANATAMTNAIAALDTAGSHGGTVVVPAGDFLCEEIHIPKYVRIAGAGSRATYITYADNGSLATLGSAANDSNLNYGCGLRDLGIILTHKDGTAVYMRQTADADVANLYIEGPATAGRTSRGVVIDGGNISAFGNHIQNVRCNHIENGFVITTTGSQRATQQHFTNCHAFGDVLGVGTSSKGLSIINSGGGDGTIWTGGGLELLGTGFYHDATALSINVFGPRCEANTVDVVLTAGCKSSMYFGNQADTAFKVTDPNGVGGFYGGTTVSGSRWSAQGTFTATLTTMSSPTTGSVTWRRMDKIVELYISSSILGTLNGTSLTLTGLPQGLTPSVNKSIGCGFIENNGASNAGIALVKSDNTIVFYINTVVSSFVRPSASGFTTATSTGLQAGWAIRYGLD